MLENDDADADTLNSLIEVTEIPGDFALVVEVATVQDSYAGAYTLTVEGTSDE